MKKKTPMRVVLASLFISIMLAQSSCGIIVWNDNSSQSEHDTGSDTAKESVSGTETDDEKTNTIPPSPADEARIRLSQLPAYDFSGTTVIIATVDNITVCPSVTDDDPVTLARADATSAVAEKYGTSIITVSGTSSEIYTSARAAHNSEMFYADIMAVPASEIGSFYSAGILANLYSLPHIDYTEEYFDAGITSAAVAGDGLYAVSGAANFNPDYLSCIYFNRHLAAEYTDENLYALVNSGEWTWDKFREISKATENVDGVYGHGSLAPRENYIDLAVASLGISYTDNTVNTVPKVNYLDNKDFTPAKTAVDRLYDIFIGDGTYANATGSEALSLFINDSMIFMTERLYVTEWLSDGTLEWGILPLPKFDEAQETYISPLSVDSPLFCVPKATRDYEMSAAILTALNAAAYDYTTDAYIKNCTDYMLRDNASIGMLELICDTASIDFAHLYASSVSNLKNATFGAVHRAITTRSTLDALYRNYKGSANYALSNLIKVAE